MLPKHLNALLESSKVYDLGQPYYTGMPHHPNHPPFAYSLTKKHGDIRVGPHKVSFCNDLFTMGGHTGTHLDAKVHVARDNRVTGEIDISDYQDYQKGVSLMGIDSTPPIVRRGVLLDIPALLGLEVLPHDYGIGEKDLQSAAEKQGVAIEEGDVVLVRTGWIQYWDNRQQYLSHEAGVPGVVEDGARFLASKKIAFTGSDTTAYEKVPSLDLPCHVILLMENGIQIMEMVNLEELSREAVYHFLFIALPLKIRGGVGSPIRPIAIA